MLSPKSLQLQQFYTNTSCLNNQPKDLYHMFLSVGSLRMNNWDQSAAIQPIKHLVDVPVSWDTSNILFLSDDIESNPGPRLPDENPIYCTICCTKIKRDIQQETTSSSTETNGQLQCHWTCNEFTVAQTHHTKMFWPPYSMKVSQTCLWYCQNCCSTSANFRATNQAFSRW